MFLETKLIQIDLTMKKTKIESEKTFFKQQKINTEGIIKGST